MKLLKFLASAMFAMSAICLVACSDDDDEPTSGNTGDGGNTGTEQSGDGITMHPSNPDVISLTADEGASGSFRFVSGGNWNATADVDWLTLDPASGAGDSDWQTVTVTASANSGETRTATVTIAPESGEGATISVEQAAIEGTKVDDAVLTFGGFTVNKESEAAVSVSYENGHIGETVEISVEISGSGATGLSVDTFTATITETNGTFEAPISGTPTVTGTVTFSVAVKIEGEVAKTTNIQSGVYTLYQGFEKFKWGGKYVEYETGLMPEGYGNTYVPTTTELTGLEDPTEECRYDQSATQTLQNYTEDFQKNVGVGKDIGYDGGGDYMYWHQLRLGSSTDDGKIKIEYLENLSKDSGNTIKVTFDACRWVGDPLDTYTTADDAALYVYRSPASGENVEFGKFTTTEIPMISTEQELKWTKDLSVTITDFGKTDRIRFFVNAGGNRIFITNIRVEEQ